MIEKNHGTSVAGGAVEKQRDDEGRLVAVSRTFGVILEAEASS